MRKFLAALLVGGLCISNQSFCSDNIVFNSQSFLKLGRTVVDKVASVPYEVMSEFMGPRVGKAIGVTESSLCTGAAGVLGYKLLKSGLKKAHSSSNGIRINRDALAVWCFSLGLVVYLDGMRTLLFNLLYKK